MVRRPPVAALTEPARAAPASARINPTAGRARDEKASSIDSQRVQPASDSLGADRAAVIRSKIQPPPLRSSTLSRQRLLDRLTDAVRSRLTLVVAEAGYGKTTLLADFSSRASARCLWYKLDPTDADPITWTNHVIAAAREVDPGFGNATLSLLAQVSPAGPPESAFVASLLGELPRLGEAPTVLVLDDFHLVDDSPEARTFVMRLIKDSPPWLHIVLSSRRRPTLELARLAGMGEVVEITTDDLRFTGEEMERLFADGYGSPLDPDVLDELSSRTRGWAASLQLFNGSIRGRPSSAVRALAKSLSGASGPIYDFLAQEVLKNLSGEVEEFLLRAAILDRIVAQHAVALFSERRGLAPTAEQALEWIDECDRLGLLTRSSQSSEARQLHPLLRDFLLRKLSQRHSAEAIGAMHLGIAQAAAETEPLVASRHFIEAGDHEEAMRCLGRSVMLTMGSGQWGVASSLIDRLDGVRADPAVAAIRARHLIEQGDLLGAGTLLASVDLVASAAEARAVFRYAKLSLAWRTGDRDSMYATLHDIQGDGQSPVIMREISQIFLDASPLAARRASLPSLGQRLEVMADAQEAAGHTFYAAVSRHNASVAYLNAGDFRSALRLADMALAGFDQMSFAAPEQFSTHSIISVAHTEMGNRDSAADHFVRATQSGDEFADVDAEMATNALATGDRRSGTLLLARAESLVRRGRTDASGTVVVQIAGAFSKLPSDPAAASLALAGSLEEGPMDFGQFLSRQIVLALSYLLDGRDQDCLLVVKQALIEARDRSARRAEARLEILSALARADSAQLSGALVDGAGAGHLVLLELADAIATHFDLLATIPVELEQSIALWPARWLPALRRQLERGDVPTARVSARLLDKFGETEDVGRLRAYARTYQRRGRFLPLGFELAQRVSPPLEIRDLGRVSLTIANRTVALSAMRRKPASLLMYLLTRPAFAANREQVFDELWPDTDPASASNSLNQSLYFLRRDLDPWYEDDLSVDYVALQGELVWLDPKLVKPESVGFLSAAQQSLKATPSFEIVLDVLGQYRGPFAPEFEYEEWAMAWRSRVHTCFLELAARTVDRAIREGELAAARDAAVYTLEVDPANPEIERRLVWLLWHLGARSAAAAQHQHLVNSERQDGLESESLEELVT